jgi:hypothetical protein
LPLRAKIAQWAGVDAEAFAMALVNEYQTGSPIGWHRDASHYDIVAGVAAVGVPDEIPPVSLSCIQCPEVVSSIGDARDSAGPAVRISDDPCGADGV